MADLRALRVRLRGIVDKKLANVVVARSTMVELLSALDAADAEDAYTKAAVAFAEGGVS